MSQALCLTKLRHRWVSTVSKADSLQLVNTSSALSYILLVSYNTAKNKRE